ncbi:hypothetical protein [Gordonia crocea]|nr:hypothetical protein [Gordonia crocea]
MTVPDADTELLLRHRAVLSAVIGGALLVGGMPEVAPRRGLVVSGAMSEVRRSVRAWPSNHPSSSS